jgi:hypothetical protein
LFICFQKCRVILVRQKHFGGQAGHGLRELVAGPELVTNGY